MTAPAHPARAPHLTLVRDPLEALDFAPAVPCEHRKHDARHPGDQPAAWSVLWLCPGCERVATLHLCEPGRRLMADADTVGCVLPSCGYVARWADFVLAITPLQGGDHL
ncbi:hypothetical protein OEB99_16655 [Actinotalea sp. M2MS4P-6]|uniref:hypothetical protein n=1 Tax=Actinotalea sp. M2MS4P-6 TaxID=2983762 RepID=UPI0021E3F944|nr:hypothetical protein [Actinotalea sp. M2MS4P-6]MCV2395948.1 hypothetical protein [Actinotalea sp. M2MS4P-6]